MYDKINNEVGKKNFKNCTYFVCYINDKYEEFLLKFANPNSKEFNRKKAEEYKNNYLIKRDKPINNDLIVFYQDEIAGHVGIYFEDYVIHQDEECVKAESIDKILRTTKYNKVKIYGAKQ